MIGLVQRQCHTDEGHVDLVAEGDQLPRAFRGLDAGNLRNRQDVALLEVSRLDQLEGSWRQQDAAVGDGLTDCLQLATDVYHARVALVVQVCQFIASHAILLCFPWRGRSHEPSPACTRVSAASPAQGVHAAPHR